MLRLTIDELERIQPEVDLGVTDWITVSQPRIDAFADATEDRQWIHIDPERAAAGPFGGTVAHGFLTLSLASVFLLELVQVDSVRLLVNYGLNRVRFPSPVHAGASVRATGSIVAVESVPGGVQATTRLVVTAEGAEKPALVADCLTRFLR